MNYTFTEFAPEVEFDVVDFNKYFEMITGTRFEGREFEFPVEIDGSPATLVLDNEYYSQQCEWKVKSVPFTLANLKGMKSLIEEKTKHPCVALTAKSPAFVGTHFHFWVKHKSGYIAKPRKGRMEMTAFIIEYFHRWFHDRLPDTKKGLSKVGLVQHKLIVDELHRFVRNHNLWHYFDYNNLNGQLVNNLSRLCSTEFPYMGGRERAKYQPIVWSPATESGKPLTLEIRIIPNSFFIFEKPEVIFAFFKDLENVFNESNKRTAIEEAEFVEGFKNQIVMRHASLCKLYKGTGRAGNFDDGSRGFTSPEFSNTVKSLMHSSDEKCYANFNQSHRFNNMFSFDGDEPILEEPYVSFSPEMRAELIRYTPDAPF